MAVFNRPQTRALARNITVVGLNAADRT